VTHFQSEHVVPVAVAFSMMTAVFYFFSPLLLAVGFLTRMNAIFIFCGLLVTLNADLDGVLSTSLHSQTIFIYLLITVLYAVHGGGMMAADRFFDRRRGRLRRAGSLYAP
ncbi:MAG: hypothetical protein AAGJ31_11140, partial [Verrucomicrobiota bacterium]